MIIKRRTYWVDESQIAFVYQWQDDDYYKIVIQDRTDRVSLKNYVKNRKFRSYTEAQSFLDRIAYKKGWSLKIELEEKI